MTSYKQVILVRQDLNMPKGKLAVQCSHAAVDAALSCPREKLEAWKKGGMKKVALKVSNLEELQMYAKKARAAHLLVKVITDAGKTFFSEPTITCVAIGPDREDVVDKITGSLKML